MPNRFQRQINTVEEVMNLELGTLLDVSDGSGVVMRAKDHLTDGLVLLNIGHNSKGDWLEVDEKTIELFAPFYVIWEPPMFACKEE